MIFDVDDGAYWVKYEKYDEWERGEKYSFDRKRRGGGRLEG